MAEKYSIQPRFLWYFRGRKKFSLELAMQAEKKSAPVPKRPTFYIYEDQLRHVDKLARAAGMNRSKYILAALTYYENREKSA